MPGRVEYVPIDVDEVTVIREKAIQIRIDDKRIWVPRHAVRHMDSDDPTRVRVVEMTEDAAIERELV